MTRKTLILLVFLAGLLSIVPQSCENNNELELYGIQDCDTIDITWDSKIEDIFARNCVECHNKDLNYNSVRHDSYEEELKVLRGGKLRGVVNHQSGFSKMPNDRKKLPACELLIINAWLDNGAPEK